MAEAFVYNATLVKVVDGDTIDVDLDLGFGVWIRNQRCRLHGIDTPESRTRDLAEKKLQRKLKQCITCYKWKRIDSYPETNRAKVYETKQIWNNKHACSVCNSKST